VASGAVLFPLRLGPPELNLDNKDAFVEAMPESALSQLGAQVRLDLIYAHRELDATAIRAMPIL
jgi:serine O-acetyltransferase